MAASDPNLLNIFITSVIFGTVGGGLVSLVFKTLDTHLIARIFKDRKKLEQYAKPLWLSCVELKFRLKMISENINKNEQGSLDVLKLRPHRGDHTNDFSWYTHDGYYATSTVYLITKFMAWISLYEQDTVFLKFKRKSATKYFIDLIEKIKTSFSTNTILWYYYLESLGDSIIDQEKGRPLAFQEFCHKLHLDTDFKTYFEQIFSYLKKTANNEYTKQLTGSIDILDEIGKFLIVHGAIPVKDKQELEVKLNQGKDD